MDGAGRMGGMTKRGAAISLDDPSALLLARHASRDLFDTHHLPTKVNLDQQKLRLGFVLYGAMNRKDWRTVAIQDVSCDPRELENHLLPVIRGEFLDAQKTGDWAERMLIAECRQALDIVLPLNAAEKEFLDRILDHGQIEPQLLTAMQKWWTESDRIHCCNGKPSTSSVGHRQAIRGHKLIGTVERVQEQRRSRKGKRTDRPCRHKRILPTADIERRMWITEQTVQPQCGIVATDMLTQGLKFLPHGEAKPEELDSQLLENFGMQGTRGLTDE